MFSFDPLIRGSQAKRAGGWFSRRQKANPPLAKSPLAPPLVRGAKLLGFTLIELLVVFAIIATLLTIAVPRYFASLDRSKEAVLKENLYQMRDAIGKYYGDKGKYPESLEALATDKYLRKVPLDPITESATTWQVVAPEDPQKTGVFDVRSGAPGKALDGSEFSTW
jgi:general secretion pathway protein G